MNKKDPYIQIVEMPDGRFFAEYLYLKDKDLCGLGQFGASAIEAQVNLEALIVAYNIKRFSVGPQAISSICTGAHRGEPCPEGNQSADKIAQRKIKSPASKTPKDMVR